MRALLFLSLLFVFSVCNIKAQEDFVISNSWLTPFYIGIDNPMHIVVSCDTGGDFIFSCNVPDTIEKNYGSGEYVINFNPSVVKPNTVCEIKVSRRLPNGKIEFLGSRIFYIKEVPDPTCYVVHKKGFFFTSKEDLEMYNEVHASLEPRLGGCITWKIMYFEMVIYKKDGTIIYKTSDSDKFTPEMMDLIKQLNSGDRVIIQNVHLEGPMMKKTIMGVYMTIE